MDHPLNKSGPKDKEMVLWQTNVSSVVQYLMGHVLGVRMVSMNILAMKNIACFVVQYLMAPVLEVLTENTNTVMVAINVYIVAQPQRGHAQKVHTVNTKNRSILLLMEPTLLS